MLFSVIIPTCNRPAGLKRCLQALAELVFPKDQFEVLIIDDGGAVALDPVINGYTATLHIRLLTQSNRGPAAARNLGLQHAAGQFDR